MKGSQLASGRYKTVTVQLYFVFFPQGEEEKFRCIKTDFDIYIHKTE